MITSKTPVAKKPAAKKAVAKKTAGEAAKAAPWDRENPKKSSGEATQHLTPEQKASAKRSARKAGRPYPNLVDNMREAAKDKK